MQKGLTALPGIRKLLQKLNSQDGRKAQTFLQIAQSRITNQHHIRTKIHLRFSKKKLNQACDLALKQPIPGKQLVLMTDASFRKAACALMIEDNPDQKIKSKRETYAPVAIGSKIFSRA